MSDYLVIFYFSLSFFYSSSSITFNPPLTLIRVLMVLGQHTYQILGELGMQGGKAWVRRAYSGALNGLKNGVVSVLWKSAIGPFSILVFLYIMFVVPSPCRCSAHSLLFVVGLPDRGVYHVLPRLSHVTF
jgi:hypothetical protein